MAVTVQRSGEFRQDTAVVADDVVDVRHGAQEDDDVVVVRVDGLVEIDNKYLACIVARFARASGNGSIVSRGLQRKIRHQLTVW